MTADQKEKAAALIREGDKLEAVRYLQQTLHIDAAQALRLAEKLEDEVDTDGPTDLRKEFEDAKKKMRATSGVNLGRTIGLIFMCIGIPMLAFGFYYFYDNYVFAKRAIPVIGHVIDYDSYYSSDSDGGGSTMYTPIYEYTYYGNKKTHIGTVSSSSKTYDIGEEVEILVDQDNPNHVLVNTFWDRYFAVVMLGFLGTLFTVLGYLAFWAMKR